MHVRYSIEALKLYAHAAIEYDAANLLNESHELENDPLPVSWRIGGYAKAGPLAAVQVYGNRHDPELKHELDEGLLQLEAMRKVGGEIARIDSITRGAILARSLG